VINRENAQRRIVVRATVSFGQPDPRPSRQSRIRSEAPLSWPTGYYIVYGGQYEAQSEAVDQIMLLGSAAIVGFSFCFPRIWLSPAGVPSSWRIFRSLSSGGIAAVLIATEGETSVASLVGFITLSGIAIPERDHAHHALTAICGK